MSSSTMLSDCLKPNRPLFLTEAGDGIGFGHFARCSALAENITDWPTAPRLVVDLHGANELPRTTSYELLQWRQESLVELVADGSTVVVDSYLATSDCYAELKSTGAYVVVIDDYNRLEYSADLILNPNVSFSLIDYSNQSTSVVGGSEYSIVRQPFQRSNCLFSVKKQLLRVLVTLGGSDYRSLLPKLLGDLNESLFYLEVVAGSAQLAEDLRSWASPSLRVHGCVSPEEMARLMLSCDAAVSAGGQTLNELACLGIPTVAVCIDKDQRPNVEAFQRAGFLPYWFHWDKNNLGEAVLQGLEELSSIDVRQRLSQAGHSLVDGLGPVRFWQLVTQKGGQPDD